MAEERQRPLNHLRPGDIIEWRQQGTGRIRQWWVHGIHYGGIGEESVIAIEAIDLLPAWDEVHLPIMWVPDVLTRTCRICGHAESRDEAAAQWKARQ